MLGLWQVSKDLKQLGSALPARRSRSACRCSAREAPTLAVPAALRARAPLSLRLDLHSFQGGVSTMDCGTAASAVPREKVLPSSLPRGAASAGGQFVPRGKDRKRAFLQPRLARDNAIVSQRSDRSHRRAALASGSLDAGQPALQPAERRASPPVPSCPLPSPPVPSRRRGHASASAGNLATAPDLVTSPLRAAPTRPGRAFVLSSLGAGAEF
ncbi:hypothetical protein NN561_020177 [Cricetulus griseus]